LVLLVTLLVLVGTALLLSLRVLVPLAALLERTPFGLVPAAEVVVVVVRELSARRAFLELARSVSRLGKAPTTA
jgi:hypothetical protein